MEQGKLKIRIMELETQLSAKKDKVEQVQERSGEFLQQINQMLQEKLSDQRKHEQLQLQNAALKIQLEELQPINTALKIQVEESQRELKRLQEGGPLQIQLEEAQRELKRLQEGGSLKIQLQEAKRELKRLQEGGPWKVKLEEAQRELERLQDGGPWKAQLEEAQRELKRLLEEGARREVVRPAMAHASVNTDPIESSLVTPPLTVSPIPPASSPSTLAPPSPFMPMEACIRLMSAESKVFPQLNLHHLYEIQRDLFLIMAGKKLEEELNQEQFQTLWEHY